MSNTEQYKVKGLGRIPLLAILVILTLFSSCSVRKSLQAQLGLAVSKQLNPTKTTFTGEQQCKYADQVTVKDQTKKLGLELPIDFTPSFLNLYLSASEQAENKLSSVADDLFISDKVPFYILYKMMKLWR